jgi:tetratricopeptide (TPR) repeat protein
MKGTDTSGEMPELPKKDKATYFLGVFFVFVLFYFFLEKFHKETPSPVAVQQPVSAPPKPTALVDLQASQDSAMKRPCFETYFKLGFDYFNSKRFPDAAEATLQALRYNPNSYAAWNNLCSAYNELHEWDKAIVAGTKAVQLKPDFELAKNNLNWAQKNKAEASVQKTH